jgi:hypothetical protein
MATQYPDKYPCPQLDGFSQTVSMGVARTEIPYHQAQRRIYKTMPTTVSMTFVMTISQLGDWQNWILQNGFDWFWMNLPGLYAGREDKNTSAVLVRLVSGVSVSSLSSTHVEVSCAVEYSPSMVGVYLGAV